MRGPKRTQDRGKLEPEVRVPIEHREGLGQDTFVVGETEGTARSAEIRALVDVRDPQAPTLAAADLVTDLVAAVADAVDDV